MEEKVIRVGTLYSPFILPLVIFLMFISVVYYRHSSSYEYNDKDADNYFLTDESKITKGSSNNVDSVSKTIETLENSNDPNDVIINKSKIQSRSLRNKLNLKVFESPLTDSTIDYDAKPVSSKVDEFPVPVSNNDGYSANAETYRPTVGQNNYNGYSPNVETYGPTVGQSNRDGYFSHVENDYGYSNVENGYGAENNNNGYGGSGVDNKNNDQSIGAVHKTTTVNNNNSQDEKGGGAASLEDKYGYFLRTIDLFMEYDKEAKVVGDEVEVKLKNNNSDYYKSTTVIDYKWSLIFRDYNTKRLFASNIFAGNCFDISQSILDKTVNNVQLVLNEYYVKKNNNNVLKESLFVKYLRNLNVLSNYLIYEIERILKLENSFEIINKEYYKLSNIIDLLYCSIYIIVTRFCDINFNSHLANDYDWFIYTGRVTETLLTMHVSLCRFNSIVKKSYLNKFNNTVDNEQKQQSYYYVRDEFELSIPSYTRHIYNTILKICTSFSKSLGVLRKSSNTVCVSSAFLYASCLKAACENNIQPINFIDGLVKENDFQYLYENIIKRIGRPTTYASEESNNWEKEDMDGIYVDRSFFAHKSLRMYSYLRPYCEQIFTIDVFLSVVGKQFLTDIVINIILRAVEPMCEEKRLYYFTLHSRSGVFKFDLGYYAIKLFGSHYLHFGAINGRHVDRSENEGVYGRIYIADRGQVLFCNSEYFTYHALGHTNNISIGEIDRASLNTKIMHAFSMGQRPLFTDDKSTKDVPGPFELEPCVIDSSPVFGYHNNQLLVNQKDSKFKLLKNRNTTNFKASYTKSSIVSLKEIGAVATFFKDVVLEVSFIKLAIVTPFYIINIYTRVKKCDESSLNADNIGDNQLRLSVYTGTLKVQKDTKVIVENKNKTNFIGYDNFEYCDLNVHHSSLNDSIYTYSSDSEKQNIGEINVLLEEGIGRRKESKIKNRNSLANLSVVVNTHTVVNNLNPLVLHWIVKNNILPVAEKDILNNYRSNYIRGYTSVRFYNSTVTDFQIELYPGAHNNLSFIEGIFFKSPCMKFNTYFDKNICLVCNLFEKIICVSDYKVLEDFGEIIDIKYYIDYLNKDIDAFVNKRIKLKNNVDENDVIIENENLKDDVEESPFYYYDEDYNNFNNGEHVDCNNAFLNMEKNSGFRYKGNRITIVNYLFNKSFEVLLNIVCIKVVNRRIYFYVSENN